MQDININIGAYRVYSSGSVVGIHDVPIIFKIIDLEFQVVFKNDLEKPDARFVVDNPDNKKAVVTIFNFNSNVGVGLTKPRHMGWIDNDNLYLNFIVHSIGNDSGKLLHYTWLLKEKEAKNA